MPKCARALTHTHTGTTTIARAHAHTCVPTRTPNQAIPADQGEEEEGNDRLRELRCQQRAPNHIPKMLGFLLNYMYAGTLTHKSLKGSDYELYENLAASGLPIHLGHVKVCKVPPFPHAVTSTCMR